MSHSAAHHDRFAYRKYLPRVLRSSVALFFLLTLSLLLTGFAAQVPSAPIDVPPAPPTSGANLQPVLSVSMPLPDESAPAKDFASTAVDSAPSQQANGRDPATMLPNMLWYLDRTGTMSVADIAGEDAASRFAPWSASHPGQTGTLWLKFELAPMITGMRDQVYLHLGPSVSDTPQAWMRRPGAGDPIVVRPEEQGTYPILYSHNGGEFFLRLERWPTFGFAPWLGPLESDAENMATLLRYALLALLLICAVCSLIRGMLERREWRIWAGLFAAAALLQGLWGLPGLPLSPSSIWNMPLLLAPGCALFFMPQAGRQLMQPRNTMAWLDNMFLGVMILGLLIGLVPLIPSQGWLYRYLPLWPLGFIPTVLLAMLACRKGLAGCGRFLAGCTVASAGAVVLLLFSGSSSELRLFSGLGSLGGLTLAALLFAVVGGKPGPRATLDRRAGFRRGTRGAAKPLELDLPVVPEPTPGGSAMGEATLKPVIINDPRRTESAESSTISDGQEETAPPTPETDQVREEKKTEYIAVAVAMPESGPAPIQTEPPPGADAVPYEPRIHNHTPAHDSGTLDADTLIRLEETLRVPLDAMLRESIALDMCELPDEARPHVAALIGAGKAMTNIVTGLSRSGLPDPARAVSETSYIDLPKLLREAHVHVEQAAEARSVAVSWYMAPHLGRRYAGPHGKLLHALKMLMESAVLATERGSIQLWVRRQSESNDPGHLVFTVADTGSGMPPERRSSLLPAKIWELVGETGGTMHVDSGPEGTTFSFSVLLKPLPAHGHLPPDIMMPNHINELDTEPLNMPSLRILIADDNPSRRQLTAYMLEDLPHDVTEARSSLEAVNIHQRVPARLIMFDASMPEKDIVDAIASIRSFDGSRDEAPTTLVAVADYAEQGEALARAGIDFVLYRPAGRAIVRQTVLHMAPPPGTDVPPLPEQAEPPRAPRPETGAQANAQSVGNAPKVPHEEGKRQLTQNEIIAEMHDGAGDGRHLPETSMQPVASTAISGNVATPSRTAPTPQRTEQEGENDGAQRQSVVGRLLGALPRKRIAAKPLPEMPPATEQGTTEERFTPRAVGEPRPMPAGGQPEQRPAPTQRPAPWVAPPRLATPSDDSKLSENGVGEPMPLVKNKLGAEPLPVSPSGERGVVGHDTPRPSAPPHIPQPQLPNSEATPGHQAANSPAPQAVPSNAPHQAPLPEKALGQHKKDEAQTREHTGIPGLQGSAPQPVPYRNSDAETMTEVFAPVAPSEAEFQKVNVLPEQDPGLTTRHASASADRPQRSVTPPQSGHTPAETMSDEFAPAPPSAAEQHRVNVLPDQKPEPTTHQAPSAVTQTTPQHVRPAPHPGDTPSGLRSMAEAVPVQWPTSNQPPADQRNPGQFAAPQQIRHSENQDLPAEGAPRPMTTVSEPAALSAQENAEAAAPLPQTSATGPGGHEGGPDLHHAMHEVPGVPSEPMAAPVAPDIPAGQSSVSGSVHEASTNPAEPVHDTLSHAAPVPSAEQQQMADPCHDAIYLSEPQTTPQQERQEVSDSGTSPEPVARDSSSDNSVDAGQTPQPVRGSLLDLIHHVGPSDPTEAEAAKPTKQGVRAKSPQKTDIPGLTEMGDTLPGTSGSNGAAHYDPSAFEPKAYNENAFEPAPFEPLSMITREETAPAPSLPMGDPNQDAVVEELLRSLDETLVRIQSALYRRDTADVVESTGIMADYAERYGLHVLARLSRGMQEMAVEEDGLDTVKDTMPDLRAAVERNRGLFRTR